LSVLLSVLRQTQGLFKMIGVNFSFKAS
jgi:hypothetical protein